MKKNGLLMLLIGLMLVGCGSSGDDTEQGLAEPDPTQVPPKSTPAVPTPTPVPCLFAFTSGTEEVQNIYVMDGSGGAARPLNTHDGMDGYISWSPDGTQFVFDSRRGDQWNIYIMDVNGSNETQLTFTEKASRHPSFSPEGNQIVFSQSGEDEKAHLFIMDTNGGNQRQLTFGEANDYDPVWSPVSSQIVYISDANWAKGLFDIFSIDASGGDQIQLTNSPTFDWNCGWMPDGSKIYFRSNSSLVAMDLDGSNQETLFEQEIFFPSWSPDASQIAFDLEEDDGTNHIYIMDADGSNMQVFTTLEGSQWSGVWSPVCP
jgi:Tol biopolymer transport system component